MPFCPFFCPYMNQHDENDEDEDFRSPNGFGPPFGPPSGGQGGPPGPPPSITPTQKSTLGGPTVQFVDPGAIRPCRFQFVYIWPSYGRPFWAWLTFVGRRSVSGFRWNGRRWVYFGIDLRQIESFECY